MGLTTAKDKLNLINPNFVTNLITFVLVVYNYTFGLQIIDSPLESHG